MGGDAGDSSSESELANSGGGGINSTSSPLSTSLTGTPPRTTTELLGGVELGTDFG